MIDYPMIAYKSFMSDNSEIVLCNAALKREPQQIIQMESWQFICFVNAALMRDLAQLHKLDSKILFIAKHTELEDYRLFMLKFNPWVRGDSSKDFGKVICLSTVKFKLPPVALYSLKRVELLLNTSDNKELLMQLMFQYESSLWTVPLSTLGEPRQILPTPGLVMQKNVGVRNKRMEDQIFYSAYAPETSTYSILRVSLDTLKPGEVIVTEAFKNE